jgi:hypothetical protein
MVSLKVAFSKEKAISGFHLRGCDETGNAINAAIRRAAIFLIRSNA